MCREVFGLGSSITDGFEPYRPILKCACDAIPRMSQASHRFFDNCAHETWATDAQSDGMQPVTMVLPIIFGAEANKTLRQSLIIDIEQGIEPSPLFYGCQVNGAILKKNTEVSKNCTVHAFGECVIGFGAGSGIGEHLVDKAEIGFLQKVIAGSVIGVKICFVV